MLNSTYIIPSIPYYNNGLHRLSLTIHSLLSIIRDKGVQKVRTQYNCLKIKIGLKRKIGIASRQKKTETIMSRILIINHDLKRVLHAKKEYKYFLKHIPDRQYLRKS